VALPLLRRRHGQQEIWIFSTAMPLSQIELVPASPVRQESLSLQLICYFTFIFFPVS
jgi:hypothetical protein